jgi:hypothetical protein
LLEAIVEVEEGTDTDVDEDDDGDKEEGGGSRGTGIEDPAGMGGESACTPPRLDSALWWLLLPL